jgi:hypothetical protein
MVQTMGTRRNFSIIARHKGFGGGFDCVLPVKAFPLLHILGVSHLPCNRHFHPVAISSEPCRRNKNQRTGDRFCPCVVKSTSTSLLHAGATASGERHGIVQ